jgi:competence protein ComEC
VFRLFHKGKPIALLTSDLDYVGLENLIEIYGKLPTPIAVFPHHGGNPGKGDLSSFTEKFFDLVTPDNVIFSIGRGLHGTPQPEILCTLREKNNDIKIFCTQLSEHCSSATPHKRPAHLISKYSRGAEENKCCMGTILINPEEIPISLLPSVDDHHEFVKSAAPNALCLKY